MRWAVARRWVGAAAQRFFSFVDSQSMADIAIVAFVLLGALIGFRKGFVLPLAAQGGAVLTLAALYAGPLTGVLPSGNLGLGAAAIAIAVGATVFGAVASFVVGIVHRVGPLRRVDRVMGIPLGMAAAVVTLYVALLGTLAVDAWLDPLHGETAIGPQQIAAVQSLAGANPALAVIADPAMLTVLAQSAAETPLAREELAKLDSALGFYEGTLRPELLQSRIVPLLLSAGENLPIIGRPATLPAR